MVCYVRRNGIISIPVLNSAKVVLGKRRKLSKRQLILPVLLARITLSIRMYPITSSQFIPEAFCSHFSNIVPVLQPNTIDSDAYLGFLPIERDTSIYLRPTSSIEKTKIVNDFKLSSAGSDLMGLSVIKLILPIIVDYFVRLINCCFKLGIFLDCFKIAKVHPIFKEGDRTCLSNYQPISILPVLSRIFEKIIFLRLSSHFEDNDLLYQLQFGFRRDRNTELAVSVLTCAVNQALDQDLKTVAIFLDIRKLLIQLITIFY